VGKVLVIGAVVIIAILLGVSIGFFIWWQHYKTTPAYALAVLVDAAQRNDMPTVDTIVDNDKIVDNFVIEASEKVAGSYGPVLSAVARKQIDKLAPALMPAIKQSVRDGIAARVKEVSENSSSRKPFVIMAVALPYVVTITQSGDKAQASASIRGQQVECDLERTGDNWRVVAVRDDALLQQIVDQMTKKLPTIKQSVPDIHDAIKNLPRVLPGISLP
jgi:hypothetical protein